MTQPGRVGASARRAAAGAALGSLPLAAGAVLAWAIGAPLQAVRAPGPAEVDQLVALGAAVACATALALGTLGAALTLLASATSHARQAARWAEALTPPLVRRLAGVALGVSLVAVPVGPLAAAAVAPQAIDHRVTADVSPVRRAAGSPRLPPGWTADRPAAPHRTAHDSDVHLVTTAPRVWRAEEPVVVVRRGDTLWDIATRFLGPHASTADVAAEWPRWHHANRRTIGPDPDLLRPGQRLRPPLKDRPPAHSSRSQPPGTAPSTRPDTREESP
ncbi:MAG: LysM peptidoglycan-binding domain-containing protein [Actinomycetes bacterium]